MFRSLIKGDFYIAITGIIKTLHSVTDYDIPIRFFNINRIRLHSR